MERARPDINGDIAYPYRTPQERVASFQDGIGAGEEDVLKKYKEELVESLLEHGKSGFSKEFGQEVVDVIITGIGLLHCMGLDFETLFNEKMQIVEDKYRNVPTYKSLGYSHQSAIGWSKEIYNQRHSIDPNA